MADGTLKVGEITNSAGSGNITIGSGVTVNVNRPAFMAYQGSDLNVSDDTVTKVPIDTEIFDTDSAFDTSNYRFTIPTGGDGKYFFHGSVCPEDYSAHTMYYCQIELHKNGTKVKQNFFNIFFKNISLISNDIRSIVRNRNYFVYCHLCYLFV